MIWSGINRELTSTYQGTGVSEYQQNTRMTVEGELQRRPGMAPANFSPAGGSALGMVGAFPTSGPYGCVVDSAGTINGFPVTGPRWGWPQVQLPIAQGGAWTIPFNSLGGGGANLYTFNIQSCPGTFTMGFDVSAGFQATVTDLLGNILDNRAIPPAGAANYAVIIPWQANQINVTLGVHGNWIYFGDSAPGCG